MRGAQAVYSCLMVSDRVIRGCMRPPHFSSHLDQTPQTWYVEAVSRIQTTQSFVLALFSPSMLAFGFPLGWLFDVGGNVMRCKVCQVEHDRSSPTRHTHTHIHPQAHHVPSVKLLSGVFSSRQVRRYQREPGKERQEAPNQTNATVLWEIRPPSNH